MRSGYDGDYNDKGQRHGFGRYIYSDGSIYAGSWVDGKKEGRGKLRDAKGNEFMGDFKAGKMHGQGRYVYALSRDGVYAASGQTMFEGRWKEDVRHGAVSEGAPHICTLIVHPDLP